MQRAMIVGAGKGGYSILKILLETKVIHVEKVIDRNRDAPGILYAKKKGIETGTDWKKHLTDEIDIVIEVTGNDEVFKEIRAACSPQKIVIPASVAYIIHTLLEEKEGLIEKIQKQTYLQNLIFNATGDGMVVVNEDAKIVLMNKMAEKMIGVKNEEVIGKYIQEVMPTSRLPQTLESKVREYNQEEILENGLKIITSRIPIIDHKGKLMGAFSVFKDISNIVALAEEVTNLKEIQTMLQAIIQSSEEAISVVDETGKGILINPAYTRITGLSEEQVIGKPATIDISEGESMHMKVLKTRRPVRGVAMRVGPNKKEVVVNVAPIIVDGKLKGSVGVIHDMSEIKRLSRELSQARQIIRNLEAKYTFEDIIGESTEMQLAIQQAKLAATTPATILLRGESGTGKELFAHAIHNESDRKYNKFVRVNCAALSETLLESELFGYEEGAFSGAKRGGKRGLFEEANNGSIFLDEIGELSASTQAKLLRVLQENEIIRVGGTKPISVNVRVIAATNINIEKEMRNGTFREDLFYRLNRMPIHIPPLRNRKEDIPYLCTRLIQKLNQDYGRNVEGITNRALEKLTAYDWPGNVRELENVLGRAMIFMKHHDHEIDVHHLPELQMNVERKVIPSSIEEGKTLSELVDEFEKKIILDTLVKKGGNKTETARTLGLSVRNLYYKLEKYNLEKFSLQDFSGQ